MAIPDRAPQGALHTQTPVGETQRADVTHAHARERVTQDDDTALSLTERNRDRIAKRWGVPIDEPDNAPALATDGGQDWRAILHGLAAHVHLVRDPVPSMRAVRADYKTGLKDAQQQSATAVALFRAFGLPGQLFGLIFRFLAVCSDRPGRFAGLLFITALITGSLAWAGLI